MFVSGCVLLSVLPCVPLSVCMCSLCFLLMCLCVCLCVCVCVCLMAGKSKAAASGRWRRRRTQDTMAKPTAQELGRSADSGPAPRRRRSERGSLYSSTSLALPRRAARYAGPPRATRAASRRACRSHRQRWRSEEVGAGSRMRSQREKRDSRCCLKGEEQPAVERRAAQARRRRPGSRAGSRGSIERAIAPEPARPGPVDPPRELAMLYSMPRAYRTGSRRATSYAGSPPAASSKTRAELRRAWRARPHARGRRQGRRASWRLCQARACRKTPRSARHVTEAARLGAARAAGRHRHARTLLVAPSARPPGASEPTGAPRQ